MNGFLKIGLLAILLLVSACSKTEVGEDEQPLDEHRWYMVDYAVGTDTDDSRSITDNLPANKRISSLYYLLYDGAGALLKTKEVPGINEATQWPLKLESMSWEQRQALRDTLMEGAQYTVVMLANVNPKDENAIRNMNDLATASLILPQVAYTDNTMPYIWKEKIKYTVPEGLDGRETPLKQKVKLRRLVSRLDITGNQVEASAVPFSAELEEQLKTQVKECIESALELVKNDYKHGFIGGHQLGPIIEDLKVKMTADTYIDKIYPSFPKDKLYDIIKVDPVFIQRNDWNNFEDFTLTIPQRHNVFKLDVLNSTYDASISANPFHDQLKNSVGTWIGFSGNTGIVESNKIQAIQLGKSLTIDFSTPYSIALKKNESKTLVCDVATSVSGQGDVNSWTKTVTFYKKMEEVYGGDENIGEIVDSVVNLLIPSNRQDLINSIKTHLNYGNTEGFTFTIKIPSTFNYTATIGEKIKINIG